MTITFDDREIVKKFLGAEPNPEWSLTDHKFHFDVTKENHRILVENGFYDVASTNTPIEITSSSWIYMDGDFFFVAAATYNGTEYLSFEDGILNIKDNINRHKRLI